MSLSCKINMCKRKSCALCYCCNKSLCFNHLKVHRDLINSQLNSIVNEINTINEQLMAFDDDQKFYTLGRSFVKRIGNLREDIAELRLTVSELNIEQDTTNEDIIDVEYLSSKTRY
jgi:hypothetical protein